MQSIYDLSKEDLILYFEGINEKPFRATQIFEWIYRKKIHSFDEITNIKAGVIEQLKKDFYLDRLEISKEELSVDGTFKVLFRLPDGALIETVLMTSEYGNSICVTTEVGCNMGCKFCASGLRKKERPLRTSEIVLQVLMMEELKKVRVSHVVIMGIGEPFDNYQNVLRFINIINNPFGLEVGARHISVSTCGLVPMIYEFMREPLQVNLAISLHAPDNETRDLIMPINKAYPIEVLFEAIKTYIDETNRRVTIEYILIDGVNDSISHANKLASLLRGLNAYVNLIPYNEVLENPFRRSSREKMSAFYDALKKRGINVTLRREQGFDIDAACGQLRSKNLNK